MARSIHEIINEAVDEINLSLDNEIACSPKQRILGEGGMDSFSFVCLIASVEEKLYNKYNCEISLVTENSLDESGESPFETFEGFERYVENLLEKAGISENK